MKNFAVIGIGEFGLHVVQGLVDQGIRPVAVDLSPERIQTVSELVDDALLLDATDKAALREAGIVDFDIVVVAMSHRLEASILAVMALRELGNRDGMMKTLMF